MIERVAIIGSSGWTNDGAIRLRVKTLAAARLPIVGKVEDRARLINQIVILVDDEPSRVPTVAARQARCSNMTCLVYRLGGLAYNALEALAQRDALLFADADRIVHFGPVISYREGWLRPYASKVEVVML